MFEAFCVSSFFYKLSKYLFRADGWLVDVDFCFDRLFLLRFSNSELQSFAGINHRHAARFDAS
jgi:hypothetical protein